MRLNFDQAILDQMADGVVLLDRHAVVLSSNKAAQFWMETCHRMLPVFKRLIDKEIAGNLTLPIAVDKLMGANGECGKQTKAWLCKNGLQEFAIFVVPPMPDPESVPNPEVAAKRFLALFGEPIRRHISELCTSIGEQCGAGVGAGMRKEIKRLDDMWCEISNLAELTQRDQVFISERIHLVDLISAILLRESEHRSVRFVFAPGPAPHGVLYGDASWLTYALQVLIHSLWLGAPPQGHVAINTRQLGDFIIVSGHAGTGAVPREGRPSPLLQLPDLPASASCEASGEASIRMHLCRRIVELHSGSLKVKWLASNDTRKLDSESDVESFVLTLQSGLPEHERSRASCSECRLNLQAQAYAQDIAQLMERLSDSTH